MQQEQQANDASDAKRPRLGEEKLEYCDSPVTFAKRCTYRDEFNPNPTIVTCTNSPIDFEGE